MTLDAARRFSSLSPQEILDLSADAIIVVDFEFRLLYASAGVQVMLGWVAEDFVGQEVLSLVHPDDLDLVSSSMVGILHQTIGSPISIRVATASGGWCHVEIVGRNLADADEPSVVLLNLRDTTRRRWTELATESSARFKSLVEYSAGVLILLDREGRVRTVSGGWTRALGHFWDDVVGHLLTDFVVPSDRAAVEAELQLPVPASGPVHVEARLLRHGNGEAIPHDLAIVKMVDDPVIEGFVVTAQDVSKLVEARGKLEHLATHDPLTGLPNRVRLSTHLRHELSNRPAGHDLMVLFIDLDRFKDVNDSLGHHAGDELLIRLAERLNGLGTGTDLVARLGGDEFVIAAVRRHGTGMLRQLSEDCQSAINRPFLLGATAVRLGGSIGMAVATTGDSPDTLLARADRSMYGAKAARLPNA